MSKGAVEFMHLHQSHTVYWQIVQENYRYERGNIKMACGMSLSR